jgi:hypothetical protein
VKVMSSKADQVDSMWILATIIPRVRIERSVVQGVPPDDNKNCSIFVSINRGCYSFWFLSVRYCDTLRMYAVLDENFDNGEFTQNTFDIFELSFAAGKMLQEKDTAIGGYMRKAVQLNYSFKGLR